MAVIFTILKWLGIILLVLLAVALVLLLIALLVPIHYSIGADLTDPQGHDEFPLDYILDHAQADVKVTWLWKILRIFVTYPAEELIRVTVFGKKLDVSRFLQRGGGQEESSEEEKEEEEEEEEESGSLEDRIEKIVDRIDALLTKMDYYRRIITGSCGRRAAAKVMNKLMAIIVRMLPADWYIRGTIGLGDPYRSGKIAQITSVLYPVTEEHLELDTEWHQYQLDLHIRMDGKFRLGTFVTNLVPLLFDKDCRKVFKKFMKARAKLS